MLSRQSNPIEPNPNSHPGPDRAPLKRLIKLEHRCSAPASTGLKAQVHRVISPHTESGDEAHASPSRPRRTETLDTLQTNEEAVSVKRL
jgi:hypothetical protein